MCRSSFVCTRATTTATSSSRRSSRTTCGSTPATWASRRADLPASVLGILGGPGDAQAVHLAVDGVAADAEVARDVADVAVLLLELAQQRRALGLAERVEPLGARLGLDDARAQAVLRRQVDHVEPVAGA